MSDYFQTTPTKGVAGQPLKICFDFAAAGISGPIEIKLDWGPSTVPDGTAVLSEEDPCVTLTVPATATSLLLIDTSDTSEDHAVLIS